MTAFRSLQLIVPLLRWALLATWVGGLAGTASAGFLAALDRVTDFRESHAWIIAGLPLCGLVLGWTYHRFGRAVEAGNNLILEEIHQPRSTIPLRMTPLILGSTLLSHLFGASAGREGTAVQMGASLADRLARPFRLGAEPRRTLLMAGMSAGFASVFGTPLAGAVFGLEVLAVGRIRYEALFPCLLGAVVGHEVAEAWGILHVRYPVGLVPRITPLGTMAALLGGVIFGVTARSFVGLTHRIRALFARGIAWAPARPFVGGALVALGVALLGSTRHIGLGIPTILESFTGSVPPWDFALKLVFTAVTLGAGFKGGEVTPLFFMGATLGNTLSSILPLPSPLLSAMGFVAVFAGASNTPIACTLMAMELFGADAGVYAGMACVTAYLFSGDRGIYHAQREGHAKR